jgi:hypothetical protein
MLKAYGTCKLCDSNKLLNYAGLCKRCNRTEASLAIKGRAAEKEEKALEAQKEMEKQKLAQAEEAPVEEEEQGEETDDKEEEDKEDSGE